MDRDRAVRELKALGEPHRLLVAALVAGRERGTAELQEQLGLTQPNLSRHLKVLREAGVIRERREGRNVFYRLAEGGLAGLVLGALAPEAPEAAPSSAGSHENVKMQIDASNLEPEADDDGKSRPFEEWLL